MLRREGLGTFQNANANEPAGCIMAAGRTWGPERSPPLFAGPTGYGNGNVRCLKTDRFSCL